MTYICLYCDTINFSGKFSRVQTFARIAPEAPEEIFTVLIFAVVGSLAKTAKVRTL